MKKYLWACASVCPRFRLQPYRWRLGLTAPLAARVRGLSRLGCFGVVSSDCRRNEMAAVTVTLNAVAGTVIVMVATAAADVAGVRLRHVRVIARCPRCVCLRFDAGDHRRGSPDAASSSQQALTVEPIVHHPGLCVCLRGRSAFISQSGGVLNSPVRVH